LLALIFSAVFALPNRSYTALRRGERSLKGDTGDEGSTVRAGTNRPGAIALASTPPVNRSNRRPGLIVNRPMVHESIA